MERRIDRLAVKRLMTLVAAVAIAGLSCSAIADNTGRPLPIRANQPNPVNANPAGQNAKPVQQQGAAGQQNPPAQQAPVQGGPLPASNEHLDPTTDPQQNDIMTVEREYDRFQDKISIKTEGIRPQIVKGESRIFVNVTSVTDGKEVTTKPEKLQVNLLSVADDFQYGELREGLEFILLVNDHRIRIPAKFLKAGMTRDRSPKALESFVCIVDASLLVEMIGANSVDAQLGNTEMKFGVAERMSMRRFAEEVKLMEAMPKQAAAAVAGALTNNSAKPDLVALHMAEIQEKMAQEKVDKLTASMVAKVEQKSEYIAAFRKAQELEQRKDQMSPGPDRAEVSQQWLEAKGKANLIKSQVLLEDPELIAARRELTDTQAKLKALQHPRGAN